MDYDELVQRLRVWSLDERRGDGMLLVRTADAITQLRAERDNWAALCAATGEDLRAAKANLAAARALLREWRECDEAGRHPECNAESWRPWRREIAAKVDAALAGEKNNGAS